MTNVWIVVGFAALMTCFGLIVLAVALIASPINRARDARAGACEALADTHGLPAAPAADPAARSARTISPDLNQLRAIVLEGADR